MKTCSKCNVKKSLDSFSCRKLSKDGLDYWCKCCKRQYESEKSHKPLYDCNYKKTCSSCEVIKDAEDFYIDKRILDGLESLCKTCSKVKKRNFEIKRQYGINQQEYEELLYKQNNQCAICSSSVPGSKRISRFSIDHCHKTGKIRGLLCNSCNNGLGRFKDNTTLLYKAINYLKEQQ